MTAYIQVVDGKMGLVFSPAHATPMEYKDAEVRQEQAHVQHHELIWEVKSVGADKYIVMAERN